MNTEKNKKHLSEEEAARLIDLAKQAVPPQGALRGQGEIALILRDRGFGVRGISRFLTDHGLAVSPATVGKFLRTQPEPQSQSTTQP